MGERLVKPGVDVSQKNEKSLRACVERQKRDDGGMRVYFKKLPAAPKRRFIPRDFQCGDVAALNRVYESLAARPLPNLGAVKEWFEEWSELTMIFDEYDAMTYIRKSVNSKDRRARKDYLHLIQKVRPAVAPWRDKLNRRLLEHPLRRRFPKRWGLLLRSKQNAVDLFREKNIPIQSRIEETALSYSRLMAGLEVLFKGKKRTLVQMGRYQEEPCRVLREEAWKKAVECRLKVRGEVDGIYDQLVKLRTREAKNAGFGNFRDYCHQGYDRFDYRPSDCFVFHDAVEEVVMPALRLIREWRRQEMGLERLKPWDLAVDPQGRAALNPFRRGDELAENCGKILARVEPVFGRQFGLMRRFGLLDLDNRPAKEPGGYQHTLSERQLPFIFMNAVGRDTDVRTLLHEAGHAFHTFAMREEPVLDYRHAPMEFCEAASMSMELLGNRHLDLFYRREEDRERSTRALLEGVIEVLPWIATIDAFQHWVYTHPAHSRAERSAAWMRIRRRFDGGVDWTGCGRAGEFLWQKQGHLFGSPFYYIEYGIAQMGALMVWTASLKNRRAALARYRRALALGGSRGLRELFRVAGGRLDFSAKTLRPLVEAVMEKLGF